MRFQLVVGAALLQLQGSLAAPASTASSDLDIQNLLKNLNMTDNPLRACPMIARRGLKMKGCPVETISPIQSIADKPAMDSTASSSASKRCVYRREDGFDFPSVCPIPTCEDELGGCAIDKAKRCVIKREDGTEYESACPLLPSELEDNCPPGETCLKRGEPSKRCVYRRVEADETILGECPEPDMSCPPGKSKLFCPEVLAEARDLEQQQDPARKKRSLTFPGVHISPVSGGVVNTYHGGSATVDKIARSSGLSPFLECDTIARRGEELPKRCLNFGHGPVVFRPLEDEDKTTVTDTARRSMSSGHSSLLSECYGIARRGEKLPKRCPDIDIPIQDLEPEQKLASELFDDTASPTASSKRSMSSGYSSLLNECYGMARRGEKLPKRCPSLDIPSQTQETLSRLLKSIASRTASSKRGVSSGLSSVLHDCYAIARRGEELPKRCIWGGLGPVVTSPLLDKTAITDTARRSLSSSLPSGFLNDCDTIARRGDELPRRCFLGIGPEIYHGPALFDDKTSVASKRGQQHHGGEKKRPDGKGHEHHAAKMQ